MRKWDSRSDFVHSIWFLKAGENTPKNSIEDFRLFPTKRHTFKVGEPDYLNEEIEGRSGTYDWWHIVNTRVARKEASDTLEFVVLSDYYDYNWLDEYDTLLSYFDGSIFKFWLNDKPEEIATGRIWIANDGWDSPSDDLSNVKLNYTLTKEIEYEQ